MMTYAEQRIWKGVAVLLVLLTQTLCMHLPGRDGVIDMYY